MKRTDAHRKADRTYTENHAVKNISISFKTDADKKEYQRFINYLELIGSNKNAYIKSLIKKDLDSKDIPYQIDSDDDI